MQIHRKKMCTSSGRSVRQDALNKHAVLPISPVAWKRRIGPPLNNKSCVRSRSPEHFGRSASFKRKRKKPARCCRRRKPRWQLFSTWNTTCGTSSRNVSKFYEKETNEIPISSALHPVIIFMGRDPSEPVLFKAVLETIIVAFLHYTASTEPCKWIGDISKLIQADMKVIIRLDHGDAK